MPDLSGIEIVRKLQLESPATDLPIFVFVTAYSTYAIEAFNVEASDYLVKPFTDGRIARCVDRVRRLRAQIQVEQLSNAVLSLARSDFVPLRGSAHAPRRYMQRILIPHGTRTIVVPVHEIDWIGADSDYLVIHSQGKARFLRGTLGALEQDLDPDFFVRAHRSILVNVNQIVELRRDRNGSAAMILRGGTRLPVGRRRYDDMRLRLASHAVSAIGVDR
jgi:two-component system LytT family response regulator